MNTHLLERDNGSSWFFNARCLAHLHRRQLQGDVQDAIPTPNLQGILRKAAKDEKLLDLQDVFFRYTLDVMGEIGFGIELSTLEQPGSSRFAKCFDGAQQFAYEPALYLWSSTGKLG